VPDERFERAWPELWLKLNERLGSGGRVVVHCRGGLGRAGTVAALMLIECGESPERAIGRVRAVRPGAIETAEQERWVRHGAPVRKGST
jgi:ADP-ribosyl-[dinitrogen reductase] hydrolase